MTERTEFPQGGEPPMMTFSCCRVFTCLESKKARKLVGTLLSFFYDGVSLLDVLVCSKHLRRSVDFERLRRMRRSHAPALSLSRRSPFERSLGSGSPVEIRRDFRASNVVQRSFCVELLLFWIRTFVSKHLSNLRVQVCHRSRRPTTRFAERV